MYGLIKKILFQLDPERAHEMGIKGLPFLAGLSGGRFKFSDDKLRTQLDGVAFENPIGLAAGFDKSAHIFPCLHHYGFGFVEVGTLTPKAQPGNPKPRLFRLKEQRGVINCMGFNNDGAEAAAERLSRLQKHLPLGINLGKNKVTPLDKAVEDYVIGYKKLAQYSDYMVVNVSSPNTPGLRDLQDKSALDDIFAALNEENQTLKRPIWLKVAPDLSEDALDDIAEIVEKQKVYGLIVSNTSIAPELRPEQWRDQAGGLSGDPIREKADAILESCSKRLFGRCRLIGVGGISSPEDVIRKIALGADLVQVYTAWVYHGPGLVAFLNRGLAEYLHREGMSLSELRGSALKLSTSEK